MAKSYMSRANAWQGARDFDSAMLDYGMALTRLNELLVICDGRDAAVKTQPDLIDLLAGTGSDISTFQRPKHRHHPPDIVDIVTILPTSLSIPNIST